MKPGADVSAVFYVDSEPRCVRCRVVSTGPYTLETTAEQAKAVKTGCRLMLLVDGDGIARGVTEAKSVQEEGGVWRIEVEKPAWDDLDKRTYPRYDLEAPIVLRTVKDLGDRTELHEFEAATVNLSLGGAWVCGGGDPKAGALVEIAFKEWPQGGRILGVVVRTADAPGFAVKFADFIGSARTHLHGLISEAA